MSGSEESGILQISVRVSGLPLDFHMVVLGPRGYGSDAWTLTAGSTDYLGQPDCTLPGPDCVEGFPARITTLPAGRVGPILRRLTGLALPSCPPYTGGLDGYTFTVKLERGLTCVEYCWWADVPAAWEPLGAIVDEILGLADEPGWPRCRRGDTSAGRAFYEPSQVKPRD